MTATLRRGLLALALLCVLAWGAYMALNVEKAEAADTTPPTASIDSGPGDTSDGAATFTFSADEPSTFECKLVTAANATVVNWASCTGSKTYSGLSDGDYIFRVRATDAAGNVSAVKGLSFTVTSGGTVAQCADGLDNDGDGKIDLADPGCSSASDDDEFNSPPATSAVIVGAGDIAAGSSQDNDTGELVRQQLAAGAFGAFTLGDNAYPDGLYTDYTSRYDKSWGSFKNKTYPTYGNHDYYGNASAAGADQYWASGTGTAVPVSNAKSFYAYNVGTNWRVIVLNSASTEGPKGNNAPSCASGSAQMNFLNSELNTTKNTVLMWHHSRFSNGTSHNSAEGATGCSRTFWDTAYDKGGDLVLSGHSHLWERFSDRLKDGSPAGSVNGLSQITAGTGGGGFDGVLSSKNPQPDKVIGNSWGICKLQLNQSSADVTYIPAPGAPGSDSVTVPVR